LKKGFKGSRDATLISVKVYVVVSLNYLNINRLYSSRHIAK